MSQGIEIGAEKAGELIEYITETPIQAAKSAMGATVRWWTGAHLECKVQLQSDLLCSQKLGISSEVDMK